MPRLRGIQSVKEPRSVKPEWGSLYRFENKTIGSILGRPLTLQYKSTTISYNRSKSTASSIFRSR